MSFFRWTTILFCAGLSFASQPDAHNRLTAEEQRDGWRLLFDGNSTDRWLEVTGRPFPPSWTVEDGCLKALRNGDGLQDLRTAAVFDSFELRFEWRIQMGGNSGVEYLVQSTDRWQRKGEAGFQARARGAEYQIVDNASPDGSVPERSTASLYSVLAPRPGAYRRPGEWNQSRIVVDGDRVEHWLNGSRVVEYFLWQPEIAAMLANNRKNGELVRRSPVCLQNHGTPVWFRDLKIRPIQEPARWVDYVDPLIDTMHSRWIYFSSACRPFGMVNLSPDTSVDGDWGAGYRYDEPFVRAISHVHDWQLAAVPVLPAVGDMNGALGYEGYKSPFSHTGEVARAGYHRVFLERYGITAELTSTKRVGFHRYRFPSTRQAYIYFDVGAPLGPTAMQDATLRRVGDRELAGYSVMAPTARRKKPSTVYFVIQLDHVFDGFGGWRRNPDGRKQVIGGSTSEISGPDSGGYVHFNFDRPTAVLMKVAISYVSEAQARLNLASELPDWDFDRVVADSAGEWNEWLGKIAVHGGAREQRVKFYTDLWHALLGRRTYSDVNGEYTDNTGPQPRVRQVPLDRSGRPTRDTYTSDAFWGAWCTIDTLWSLGYPRVMNDQLASLLDYYRNGGLIARGPSGGNYTFVMIGDQAIPLIAAAYNKGIRDFDIESAWAGSVKNAMPGGIRDHAGYETGDGARGGGMQYYIDRGYVPLDAGGE